MATKSDALYVSIGSMGTAPHQRPFSCNVSPVVLFSVLDHYLRRNANQQKVVGALLGVRSDDGTEVEIRNAFSLIYALDKTNNDIILDEDHYKTMLELHRKVNPEELILGWYTAGEKVTPVASALQTSFAQDCAPFNPIHITIDPEALFNTSGLGLNAYTTAPVGFSNDGDCMFLPVPCDIKYLDAERSGLEMLASAKTSESRTASLLSDMDHLEVAIVQLQDLLDKISKYVDNVVAGKTQPNNSIGRYIMDTVSVVPKIDGAAFEKMFNSHLQDLLMVVYLANMTRTQLSVAEKLHLLVNNN
ncbi:maintenance of mitochondrial structure and function-domain-containing protein [Halteromyces radiatus]|uniref:maintenance of mitochondrial structure and function-domain-containing protein n=1 Tax=Halteromyces radiatus TaxID=101107 RepID=UPI002220CA70|nr:maintenance of mitochondrial structure and function-domain-containing protein [Halteromyces radiatus]KAI8097269.1 maintenance of mitochondrial structure and function-domain-containing protein [Halteromyces radiatus]